MFLQNIPNFEMLNALKVELTTIVEAGGEDSNNNKSSLSFFDFADKL